MLDLLLHILFPGRWIYSWKDPMEARRPTPTRRSRSAEFHNFSERVGCYHANRSELLVYKHLVFLIFDLDTCRGEGIGSMRSWRRCKSYFQIAPRYAIYVVHLWPYISRPCRAIQFWTSNLLVSSDRQSFDAGWSDRLPEITPTTTPGTNSIKHKIWSGLLEPRPDLFMQVISETVVEIKWCNLFHVISDHNHVMHTDAGHGEGNGTGCSSWAATIHALYHSWSFSNSSHTPLRAAAISDNPRHPTETV